MSSVATAVLPVGLKPNRSYNLAGGITRFLWFLTTGRSTIDPVQINGNNNS